MRIILFSLLFLFACVSSTKHKQLSEENQQSAKQIKNLKTQLNKVYQQLSKQKDSINSLQEKINKQANEIQDLSNFAIYDIQGMYYLDSVSYVSQDKKRAFFYLSQEEKRRLFYLTQEEKNVLFYLNMARMFPQIFMNNYLKPLIKKEYGTETKNSYVVSLLATLEQQKPLPPLKPNEELYKLAKCHAITSGKSGYHGHKRDKSCKGGYFAECCSYGMDTGLGVIYQLLVDDGVSSLGHRTICLDNNYKEVGISTQPHKTYRTNTVLDFR